MTEEQLDKLNVYELRNLARNTGVASPTSKCKGVLIREIIAISTGRQEKHVPKNKKGRPPKNFVGYGFSSPYITDDYTRQYSDRLPSTYFQLAQEAPRFILDDVTNIVGYVEYLANNTIIIRPHDLASRESIIVPLDVAKRFALKSGDLVSCEFDRATVNTPAVCKDILNINNCPIMEYSINRSDYFNIRHIRPTMLVESKDAKYSNLSIKHGETAFIYSNGSGSDNTETLIEYISSIQNSRRIYINPSISERDKSYLDELYGVEKFVSPMVADTESTIRILTLAINRARRIFERGERVVIVIDDIKSIAGIDQDLIIVKNLLSLTKQGDNNGSVTVVALLPQEDDVSLMFDKSCDHAYTIEGKELIEIITD